MLRSSKSLEFTKRKESYTHPWCIKQEVREVQTHIHTCNGARECELTKRVACGYQMSASFVFYSARSLETQNDSEAEMSKMLKFNVCGCVCVLKNVIDHA